MRRWIVASLVCVACTRGNPAFDESRLTDSGTDGDGDGGDGDGDGESSTTTDMPDMGTEPSVCEYAVHDGLAINVGGPQNFGGVCANGVNVTGKILSVGGGELVVESCEPGCETCFDTQLAITAFPLLVDQHVPAEIGKCVSIQSHGPLGEEPEACRFGALTIYDGDLPFVIATAHSYEPTSVGLQLLGDLIPAPLKAGNCNCDDVGQGNDCCYMAPGPPEFWYYPFDGEQLFPGDSIGLDLPNSVSFAHAFKVIQAQLLHSCESPDLQLSWAVVAEL